MTDITKLVAMLSLLIGPVVTVEAQDISRLTKIGGVVSFEKSDGAVTFTCSDNSRLQLTILAPDLVRVRTVFGKPIPPTDHSWAIDKNNWTVPRWTLHEDGEAVTIATSELEVVVRRSPLLLEFRDAKTHALINADAQPMVYDSQGLLKSQMFDPSAGVFVAASKRFGFDEHFYGLGEKAARLDKRRGSFINWNSDTPGYIEGKDPIYQTIPFYIGLQRGTAYGVFFDNSYRSYFDFGRSSQEQIWFGAEGGELNYYFFSGPSIKKILERYTELTGRMPLPPLWALGNQQSRWTYYPQSVVEDVVRNYRERDLPLDAIHLDINYMKDYRVFTFDSKNFPNPKAFTEKLAREGVKVVTIVDPGVKYQPKESNDVQTQLPLAPDGRYYVFDQGVQKNLFQRRSNGELFIPKVWPGESAFVDFTLPEARQWWGDLHRFYTDNGVAGIWNDMNEPSDFVDQSGGNQRDVVSFDEGQKTTHAKNRNVFALLMARSTYEGLERVRPDQRPYVITRAAYAGIQRYSTMWIGDTNSTWDALALSLPMYMTLGLSGEPFVGGDIGGFIGRGNAELLVRSYQVGFLAPFCRNHKEFVGYDQEPWPFGKPYEDIIRKYLKLRYRLLPFLYTTLEEAHRTGVPLFRPLMLNYQDDESTYNLDDEFMIGDDLLVAPVLKPDLVRRLVYFPRGSWYDSWTSKRYEGGKLVSVDAPLETVPMFVRAGAIIPTGPDLKYVGEKPTDLITFTIYLDDNGTAATRLYEDDGISPAYKQGAFRRTAINVRRGTTGFVIDVGAAEGNYDPGVRKFNFQIASYEHTSKIVSVPGDGKVHQVELK